MPIYGNISDIDECARDPGKHCLHGKCQNTEGLMKCVDCEPGWELSKGETMCKGGRHVLDNFAVRIVCFTVPQTFWS